MSHAARHIVIREAEPVKVLGADENGMTVRIAEHGSPRSVTVTISWWDLQNIRHEAIKQARGVAAILRTKAAEVENFAGAGAGNTQNTAA